MGSVEGWVYMGSTCCKGKRVQEVSRSFPHSFEWRIVKQKCIRLMCEKLTTFPYEQDIVGNVFSLAF